MTRLHHCLLVVLLVFAAIASHRNMQVVFASGAIAEGQSTALADQSQPRRDSRVLMQNHEARCGAPTSVSESADPPTTSTVSRREHFIARDHFRRNTSPTASVKISWLGAAFTEYFVPKIETDAGSPILRVHKVQKIARDIEIIAELGAQSETQLADLQCLLLLQPNGEAGALRIDAEPNILYVRDVKGERWAVDAVWSGAGWELGASPSEGVRPLGSLVISR